jgi:glucose-6-phosphate 1-epimerase
VCWPWFGPDPEGRGRPDHGFVRNRFWDVLSTELGDGGETRLRLGCRDEAGTRGLWPHSFTLEIEITVGNTLEVALTTRNTGNKAFTVTQALHTYFSFADVRQVELDGLAAGSYIEKVAGSPLFDQRFSQQGALSFEGPVNRIYLDTSERLTIRDEALNRKLFLDREGSGSVVVWNPGIEQSRQMGDFGDEEYLGMLCVETANAADDAVQIEAGASHRLLSRIGLLT